ncbi:autotransporter outer membrane beta-barrel domain-containing protein [Escherichia coli]|uniref:autotransporter adhesin/invasin glycoprotein TibA n=15 Tax=Escherichia coli TaxID=562 RepID=UPI00025145E6|nr:autotransporter adhesin/invasin glycoprotein TibA [Escherichia coli]EHV93336.1 adhesin/invasin tibA autotransporter [Escherichia coli DEC7B]MCZ5527189.1 autotransporter adhesin/invasin glycoprotein TibA [Escherichia coli]MCZ6339156.1 autotransporter adhesin/invasin glycoprotein TibA [Escherichia coli]QMP53578.1 autotransporter outer membrane beta-barrel domain-containing protein [Escherichia coli]QMP58248.1 autotransporter outer membrane beta-barrel domain-containing protein [Escherichia co
MNKVYNTVWNESTGMWVVTSELTRKGGQRPRQIKRTVLAGLVAGLLLPSQPVLAAAYDNQTIGSGGTSSSMSLGTGDTATNTTINDGGFQNVNSGGSATSTVINSGGGQLVSSGGSATDTSINKDGLQIVSSGASATNTTIVDFGKQHVSGGSATNTTINRNGRQYISSGGSATKTTVNSGGRQHVYKNGNVTETIIMDGGRLQVEAGGSASMVTQNSGGAVVTNTSADLSGTNAKGNFSIAGGSASNMLLENDGYLTVYSGHQASDTTVGSSGTLKVRSGGNAIETTIISGGMLQVEAGGSASKVTQNSGGAVVTNTSADLSGTNAKGNFSIAGGSASNMLLENGGSLTVLNGHQATGTTINSGGDMMVEGIATDTTINSNGLLHVSSGGSVTGTIVNNGGRENINSGGSATSTTLNSGGIQAVSSGGSATSTTLNSGGIQAVSSGGNALNASVNDGGRQYLYAGNATKTTVNNGGRQYVSSGGSATKTTVNSGGRQHVYKNGNVTETIIMDGGRLQVEAGGSASMVTQNSGGAVVTNTSADLSGTNAKGNFSIAGGSASNMLLENDGYLTVYSGHQASDTTVGSSGTLKVRSGGNAIETTIISGGMLQVEAGGSASKVTQNIGGAVVTNTSAFLSGTNAKGSFSIAGGSAANMLLENGGYLTVFDGHQASDTMVGSDGTLDVRSGGVLYGTTTLTDKGTLVGDVVTNEGNLYYLNNSAATFAGTLTGTGTLTQEGGGTRFSGLLSQDGGIFLKSGGAMTMDALQANANVTTQSGTTLTLDNGTILTGNVAGDNTGAGDMAVKGASVWHLDGDSTVGALTLDNGTVDFRPSATTRLTPAFQAVSLALGSLSGSGTFRMNTDIASHTGDMLNVAGNASGNFVLDIKNTGLEPVSAGAPLQVVQTGGGDAAFTLKGGKVDAGTWEYGLSKENTNWYLKVDTPPTNPDAGNPGTGNPDAGKPDAGTSSSPVRRTTKSADAVLGMATAPAYVFNSELDNLRFRHGDVMQNTRAPGGVWGRYTGSDNRISGGASSGYTLTQNGFETGADMVFDLSDSSLAVGTFFSYSDNSIKHARGGKSNVDSTGGGLYATWFDNDGYYVDGVLKYNRFNNELRTWMSDGTAVKGDYSQNGFGGSLEAGRTFSLNENAWAQPYVRTTAFRADEKDIRLNNGMKASIGATKSLQAEAGVKLGMTLDVTGKEVKPYLSAAVSHEFSDNNKVRINDTYDFRNDISGTTGKYGLGVNAQLTPNAGVWAEARYENGKQTESPITGGVGFRINF